MELIKDSFIINLNNRKKQWSFILV
jgi:hypothetical protein